MKATLKKLVTAVALATAVGAQASSHREAPLITEMPKVDGTDLYMFNSYEPGRQGFVTLVANYIPLQDPAGGPNFFMPDTGAVYEINVDNNGDAVEDITFKFRFFTETRGLALTIGGTDVAVPIIQVGEVGPTRVDTGNLNVLESYSVDIVRGKKTNKKGDPLVSDVDGGARFMKPVDNIGNKTLPEYKVYADSHIYNVTIPGCGTGRVFVGQRKEGFVINVGDIFDLINTNPLGPVDGEQNDLYNKNVTSLALEVPISCLTAGDETVIGAWTTASLRQARILNPSPNSKGAGSKLAAISGGAYTQVSRLGAPLVNEVVIGLPDKDRFNHSKPADDGQFAVYVTNPTLPALIQTLFPTVVAPTLFPRSDLVAIFLTGVDGLNKPRNVVASEMLRLNTAITAVAPSSQNPLGVLAGDRAGFPNGRRPGDDVVDIALRAVMGVLLDAANAPSGQLPYTDGAYVDASFFDASFPYLKTPLAGSTDL